MSGAIVQRIPLRTNLSVVVSMKPSTSAIFSQRALPANSSSLTSRHPSYMRAILANLA